MSLQILSRQLQAQVALLLRKMDRKIVQELYHSPEGIHCAHGIMCTCQFTLTVSICWCCTRSSLYTLRRHNRPASQSTQSLSKKCCICLLEGRRWNYALLWLTRLENTDKNHQAYRQWNLIVRFCRYVATMWVLSIATQLADRMLASWAFYNTVSIAYNEDKKGPWALKIQLGFSNGHGERNQKKQRNY